MKNKIKENEKGSVTLFVLIAMMFFLTVGVSLYVRNTNIHRSQLDNIRRIQQQYNDTRNKDKIYKEQEEKI